MLNHLSHLLDCVFIRICASLFLGGYQNSVNNAEN